MKHTDIGNFDQMYQEYKDILVNLGVSSDIVDAETHDKLPVARTVFKMLYPECTEFLLTVSGNFSSPPYDKIVNGMCFTKRFMEDSMSQDDS